MVNLSELDDDPWSTFPVKKELLREMVQLLDKTQKDKDMYVVCYNHLSEALEKIAGQKKDSAARQIARATLLW